MHTYMKHLERGLRCNKNKILVFPTIPFQQWKIKGKNIPQFWPWFSYSVMIWIFVIGWLALCSLIGLSVDTSLNMDKRTNWKNSLSLCLQSFRVQTLKYSLFFSWISITCVSVLIYYYTQPCKGWKCETAPFLWIVNLIIQFLLISTIVAPQNWN